MQRTDRARVVFDISTSMRWSGPPVGIVRVERELAKWASTNVPNVEFVFFDPDQLAFRTLRVDPMLFLTGEATLDTLGLTNAASPGRRRTDRIPPALKPLFLWIGQSRRMTLRALEKVRLSTQVPWLAHMADRLQRLIMSEKYRKILIGPDDARRPFFAYEMALGEKFELAAGDTLICAGSGWGNTNIDTLRDIKSRRKFRMVLLCYDLIPLMFPHFFRDHDVQLFRKYMHEALATADQIILTSRAIEADCRRYCAEHGIALAQTDVTPLGFEGGANRTRARGALPPGIEPDHFAVLVATIEPRKGHTLLYRIWQRLLAEGIPQAARFRLVFVGRPGWMTGDLMADLRKSPAAMSHIVLIHDVDDDGLSALYEAAAFCVYPSQYEGYGLPVIEAFAHGKAVIASSGGAIPELVQDLSPCLDPTDEEAWFRIIKNWIVDPGGRRRFEQAVQTRFRHPTWSEAAERFFAVIAAKGPTQPGPADAAAGRLDGAFAGHPGEAK